MDTYSATVYVTSDSDFSLRSAARMLRAWEPPPPYRVKQVGRDEIRAYFGDWCLKLAWQKGCRGRRAAVECDPDPEGDHLDEFVDCVLMLVERFQGVAVQHAPNRWVWGDEDEQAIPLPSHLAGWVVRPELSEKGTYVEGVLRCPCGSEQLEFHYPGATHLANDRTGIPIPCSVKIPHGKAGTRYWFGLKAICAACRKKCVLFNSDLHGWNGFVSSSASRARKAKLPRLWPWRCLMCGSTSHEGVVYFRIDSPADFLYKTEGEFGVKQRGDAFGWFGMGIKCCGCAHQTKAWAGYETA